MIRRSQRQDAWLVQYPAEKDTGTELVLFPHAGGAAAGYVPFARSAPRWLAVSIVQYPGRFERSDEPFAASVDALAAGPARSLGARPVRHRVLFGHSMGAVVAFETARLLATTGSEPDLLYVSGRCAPSTPDRYAPVSLDDTSLLEHLLALGGTDRALLEVASMREMFLGVLRGDYQTLRNYAYDASPRLSCPVRALNGESDNQVTSSAVERWSEVTTADFASDLLPGDHFYVLTDPGAVLDRIVASMTRLAC